MSQCREMSNLDSVIVEGDHSFSLAALPTKVKNYLSTVQISVGIVQPKHN